MISILLLIAFLSSYAQTSSNSFSSGYKVIEAFSMPIDETILTTGLSKNKTQLIHSLATRAADLQGAQIIGSISQLSLKHNPMLQFSFTYKLHPDNSSVSIDIFARMLDSSAFSPSLLIVLDFLVSRLPVEYSVSTLNMTSYQQHVLIETSRDNEMLFFLNGWNNISLSGNVTHSYQSVGVFTVHYMSCEGEQTMMGWREGKDYLLYTLVVVPRQTMVQKFKLAERSYSVDETEGWRYFYGVKGTLEREFVGGFRQRYKGVNFYAEGNNTNDTYGIIYMAYPDDTFPDDRLHKSYSLVRMIAIGVSGLVLVLGSALNYLRTKTWWLGNNPNQLNEQTTANASQIFESSNGHIKQNKPAAQDMKMTTVVEVDQHLESSLKGSYNPNMIIPDLPQ